MSNPLISPAQSQGRPQAVAPQNPLQYMTQFMQNPLGALRASGYSIPDGINDPRQIANHLISSGQLGRGKLGQLQNMARMIGRK